VVIQSAADGSTASYSIPWDTYGTPITTVGSIPFSGGITAAMRYKNALETLRQRRRTTAAYLRGVETADDGSVPNPWGLGTQPPDPLPPDPPPPAYLQPLLDAQHAQALIVHQDSEFGSGLSPFGSPAPVFSVPPPGFTLRLGAKSSDQFVSGTFPLGSKTVGYIRIFTMSPSSSSLALTQFPAEIAYFQQNTDGLVVDVMANGGGNLCYAQKLVSYLTPTTFRGTAYQVVGNMFWMEVFAASLEDAILTGAPQYVIDLNTDFLNQVQQALAEPRGMTGNLPICSYTFDQNPPVDKTGANLAYTKPILVLTDNFTLSAAEAFTMFLQDNQRATIFGTRTDGGGGNVNGYDNITTYSEGSSRVTQSVIVRLNPVQTPGYPLMPYYDRVGIYPDIVQDYMTVDNLTNGGATFVAAVTKAISDLIAAAGK